MHTMQAMMFLQDADFSGSAVNAQKAQMMHAMMAILPVFILIALAAFAFMIFLYWRIFSKAGMSPWLSLLLFVPFGSIIMQCILAFGEWPALTARVVLPAYPVIPTTPSVPPPTPGV
jgi:hypothetical protein